MITAYFECDGYSEQVATFSTDDLYNICVPVLELEATSRGMVLTESDDGE